MLPVFFAVLSPIVYGVYYSGTVVGGREGDQWLGFMVSTSMLLVAALAPFLGGVSDHAGVRKRMMAAVPKATVIITNPTHFAVALQYEPGMAAPLCLAKGVDAIALKIREVAGEHRVPIVENPPLARALYATVDIDEVIPVEHYAAVAEVIGYVLRLKGRRA